MPATLKRNAVVVLALAGVFYWIFMVLKHAPSFKDVIPFGDDPYDAVGSFAVIGSVLMALMSAFRAFRPYRQQPSPEASRALVRTQEAVVLTVLITLAADAIALGRHRPMWMAAPSRNEILLLLAVLAIAAISVHALVLRSRQPWAAEPDRTSRYALVVCATSALALVVYPEQLIHRLSGHLLTVLAGAILLFAPMRQLLLLLVPELRSAENEPAPPAKRGRAWRRWSAATTVGLLLGAFAFLGEMSEGARPAVSLRLLLVGCVFLGLGLGGVLIAYAFLARPLGLGRAAG